VLFPFRDQQQGPPLQYRPTQNPKFGSYMSNGPCPSILRLKCGETEEKRGCQIDESAHPAYALLKDSGTMLNRSIERESCHLYYRMGRE
jgi:hypothetical protein